MDASLLTNWSSLISDTSNALKTSMGSSIWIDGIESLRNLNISSFFKSQESLNSIEIKALHLLKTTNEYMFPQEHFWVSGHMSLLLNSPYYAHINTNSFISSINYEFSTDEIGSFKPWNNTITLGTSFYSNHCDQVRIPFYTFNHENTHLKFKYFYADLPITDEELYELIILIEWYCISLDFILAFDLSKNNQTYLLKELYRVPHEKRNKNIFSTNCHSLTCINRITNRFKDVFLYEHDDLDVYSLISKKTLEDHRNFTKKTLIHECRKNKSSLKKSDILLFLKDMKELSLINLIYKFTGILYA